MLLQRLREYAVREGLLPPPMYRKVPIRYIIRLDATGDCLGRVSCANTKNKRGKLRIVPDCKRAAAIKPKLLADNAEYTLGIAREDGEPAKVKERHAAFVRLVQDCSATTHEPSVEAVARFLVALDAGEVDLPDNFDFEPGENIIFTVDDIYPVDLPSVRAYWAHVAATSDAEQVMQCLVCNNMCPPVKRLPISIQGIPGGQTSGMALISANEQAFVSYGLEASLIAPTCEDCGQAFGTALNALLRQKDTHLLVSPIAYIFWTEEQITNDISPKLFQATADDVRHFLGAAWRVNPEAAHLDTTPFYAAALSASGARVVVRDWIETTLGHARQNLERYFALQKIIDGRGEERWFPLRTLTSTTVYQGGKEEPVPQIGQALLHTAFHGGSLPQTLLYQVIRRIRAKPQIELDIQATRAALIKMVLLSQKKTLWGNHILVTGSDQTTIDIERGNKMAKLDPDCTDEAYLCGRLLATLEAIQRRAIEGIKTTIVDHYYGTASSAPASVYGRLIKNAQPHLTKLRNDKSTEGAAIALDRQLQEIIDKLPTALSPTFNLMKQGIFALGYYQQKAASSQTARAAKAARNATVTQTEKASTDHVDETLASPEEHVDASTTDNQGAFPL